MSAAATQICRLCLGVWCLNKLKDSQEKSLDCGECLQTLRISDSSPLSLPIQYGTRVQYEYCNSNQCPMVHQPCQISRCVSKNQKTDISFDPMCRHQERCFRLIQGGLASEMTLAFYENNSLAFINLFKGKRYVF